MRQSTAQKSERDYAVLLVEDDASALDELKDIVELEGWTPFVAKNVDAAIELLSQTPSIGVVVTDVHFVDETGETANGIQLISRAQARFPDRGLSFVVLSGDPDALRSSVQTGAVDFLHKPLDSDELVKAIDAAWATGGEERSVSELTTFLLEKMQKTATALKEATATIEKSAEQESKRREEESRQFKANMIRRALHQGSLLPWFQPQISLATGRVCGFDSVARWIDADGIIKHADKLLSFAREAGVEAEVDAAIRSASIRALSFFEKEGLEGCSIALYVSAELMARKGLVDEMVKEATDMGLDPSTLRFEVPCDLPLDGPDGAAIRENLASMPQRELRMTLNNGNGLSAVAALQGMDVDVIKLDLAEATTFHLSADIQAVANALIVLAKAMGAQVIATGVKTPFELDWLKQAGCDIAQGKQIAQPIPADDTLAWAKANLSETKMEV